jgi:hypothetical protein
VVDGDDGDPRRQHRTKSVPRQATSLG